MKRLLNSFQIVMVLLLITLMFFINLQLTAQDNLPLEWHTFWGAANGQPEDKGMAIEYADDFIYIAGFSSGVWDVDPSHVIRDYTGYSADGYVAKLSSGGEEVLWVTYLGGIHWDNCYDIAVTSGGIYVCGKSGVWGSYPSSLIHEHWGDTHYPGGGDDAFVARLDFSGNIEWLSFFGGSPGDFATDISVDETSGFIYVTGYSGGPWSSHISYFDNEINSHSPGGQDDAFALKLETDGDYLWHTFMGSTNGNGQWDRGSGIDFDGLGNVYVGGTSTGNWGVPITGFEHQGAGDIYPDEGFIAKFNPVGVRQWNMFIGNTQNPGTTDRCHDIEVDNAGNIYATGFSNGNWNSLWGTPIVEYGSNQFEDTFITKIDTDGNPVWYTILGEDGGNQGYDLNLMSNGNIFVSGFDGECWGNPVLTKPAGNSGADAYAMKLDSEGNLLWRAMMGGTVTDIGTGIAVDEISESIYLTGYSILNWWCVDTPIHPHTGNPDPAGYGDGHTDIFIAKLNPFNSVIVPEHIQITVTEGEIAETNVTIQDICNKLLWVTADVGVIVDNGDGTWSWSYNTTGVTPGNYEVIISADDDLCWEPSVIIDLEVLQANQPPVFTVYTDPVTVVLGDPAINTGVLYDPDGDEMWINSDPGGPTAIVNNGDGTWTWTYASTALGIGTHPVTIWADDYNGGVVFRFFMVNVIEGGENFPPEITCPDDITIYTTDGCTSDEDIGTATAIDDSDPDPLITNDAPDYFDLGETIVTWKATDDNGLFNTCTQTVTVVDDDPPTITFCPPAIGPIATDAGSCTATVDPGTATATDNCSVDVVGERDDGGELDDPYPFGIVTITWTASDQAGNSDVCTQTITVNKITPFLRTDIGHIVASYGDEVTLMAHLDPYDCDGFGENPPPAAGVVKFYIIDPVYGSQYKGEVDLDVAGDGTAALTVLLPEESEGTMSIGLKDVHAEYVPSAGSDFYGAELNHYGALEIVENLPPEISCPADLEVSTNEGCAWVGDLGVPIASDDADLDLDIDNDAPVEFPIGTTTVTWTATDDEGLFGSCIQMVTVVDNTPPVINLEQAEMDIEIWPPNHKYQTYSLDDLILSVEDNCTELSVYDVNIIYATSDELEDAEGEGDGNTLNDIVISEDCKSIDLRKERQGGGNGRVYKIFLAINDASGNVGSAICQVKVPHNNGEMAIDDGELYEVASNCDNRSFSIVEKGIEKFKVSLYPNPVLSELTIAYELREAANVTLAIYNCFGEVVFQVNYDQQEGKQQLHWNSEKYPNGIYYFRIYAGDKVADGKLIKVR